VAKTVKTVAGAKKYGKPIGTVLTGRSALEKHGVVAGNRNVQEMVGRSAVAFRPPRPAATHRRQKDEIRAAVELARGVRQPANFREREQISWQSPAKRAEQRARTGDVLMPRIEAVRREGSVARDARRPQPRVAIKTTFTGKRQVVRGFVATEGMRRTPYRRYLDSKLG
jgi:hypothetical protein